MLKKNKNCKEIERFFPQIEQGLTDGQVVSRHKEKLTNETKQKTSKPFVKILFDNIFTYFNLMYLVIFVAFLYVGLYDHLLFVVVIVANTLISIIQETKAKITVEKLRLISAPKVKVVRNGKQVNVFANKLVLDDIIKLDVGNQIPADCILISGTIDVNESLLTGESKPIKKMANDQLLAGSFLTSGTCYAKVDKIGKESYIQSIAAEAKQFKSPSSNLFKDLKTIIKYIGIMIVPIGSLIFVNNYFGQERDLQTAISATGTSLIGMIPAGMFLLISIALSVGVIKLAAKKTLVRDLYSIENLARANVLCFDKTGTITDGTMQVKEILKLKQVDFDFDLAMSNFLASQVASNGTSRALSEHFGLSYEMKPSKVLAFSSDKKHSATTFENFGTIALGAPDFLNIKLIKSLKQKISKRTSQGERVLLICYSKNEITDDKLPSLQPIALAILEDHIRDDAKTTMEWFKQNDVEIKIISGDDPSTVSSIAKRVGVEGAEKTISLEGMSLSDVAKIATKFTVFGRVTPEQKHALVKALKNSGKVVAMTGDGVNDTLALKEADCSIAMADGSEVARSISHLVLLNSKFSSLPDVVREGRKVVNNVQQSSALFLMKTFFMIVLSLITIITLSDFPFETPQLFPLELFIIGLPSVVLALQPNEKIIEGGFIKGVLKHSLPYGVVLLVNILIMMTIQVFAQLDVSAYDTLKTMLLTTVGYLNLARLCWPLNKFRVFSLIISFDAIILSTALFPTLFRITSFTQTSLIIYTILICLTALVLVFVPLVYNKILHALKKAKKANT